MKEKKKIVWSNREMVLVLVLLMISVAGNVGQQVYIREHGVQEDVTGTYLSGPQEAPDAEFFVLDRGMDYTIYKRGEILDEGVYSEKGEGQGQYLLASDKTGKSFPVFIYGKKVYQFQDEQNITVYDKYHDIPIYVNLPEKAYE